ncbi:MAG: deoxyribonuclease IV [Anaerolineales bacterium]|nr:deoxyribonuclease IV [Anaerolineales bacterium]
MRLGAVISTSGGLHNVFERADKIGCDSLMLFTKNNRQWHANPITDKELDLWQEQRETYSHIRPIAGHASYLINIASPKEELWEKSYQALKIEMERAVLLDVPTLTFHPGSHTGSGMEAGLARIAGALGRLLDEVPSNTTTICLETMAGQGTNVGHRFEQLAWILENTRNGEKLGVCFDPCHVFTAGYDLRTPEAYAAAMDEFEAVIGLNRLRCFHLNDSKYELGSNKDRHAHIGHGFIGLEGIANLVNDRRFQDHPAHLETPKEDKDDPENDEDMDVINLATLRSLIRYPG